MPVTIKKGPKKSGEGYMDHLVSPSQKGIVGVQKKTGSSVTEEKSEATEMAGPLVPASQLCHVTVQGGRTVNLGNYNSVKIAVQLTVPCEMSAIDAAFAHGMGWVDKKITESLKDAGLEDK